jgi:hypothetical protein
LIRRELRTAPGFDLAAPLDVVVNRRLVDTVNSTAYQTFIRHQNGPRYFVVQMLFNFP